MSSKINLKNEDAFTLIELLVAIALIAILIAVASATFFGQETSAHDIAAQQHLMFGFKSAKSEYIVSNRSYNTNVDEMASLIHKNEPALNFHDYNMGQAPSTSNKNISVTVEDSNMITLCARSTSKIYFCIRGDELGLLQRSAAPEPTQTASINNSDTLFASINPFVVEEAFAGRNLSFKSGSDWRMVSRCSGWSEPDTRACLANRAHGEIENAGPGGTGTPGWTDEIPDEGENPPGGGTDTGGPGVPPTEDPDDGGDNENPEGPEDPQDPEVPSNEYQLSVSLAGDGSGSVLGQGIDCGLSNICSETYSENEEVVLEAQADSNSTFVGFSGCDNVEANICTVAMNEAKEVEATFELDSHNLQVSLSGNGEGQVTGSGIACGSDCTGSYKHGTEVTLVASSSPSSYFSGWSGACTGSSQTCTLSMDEVKEVEASFTLQSHALTTTLSGNGDGQVSGQGISCQKNSGTCQKAYEHGTLVTLNANASSNSSFVGWSGACSGQNVNCSVVMNESKSVQAVFEKKVHRLSVTLDGNGEGSVTGSGVICPSNCNKDFEHSTQVTLQAFPSGDSSFSGWNGACSGQGQNCTVTMNQARQVEATFTLPNYNLGVTLGGDGQGSVTGPGINCSPSANDCQGSYTSGEYVSLIAEAFAGQVFVGWSGACSGDNVICQVLMDASKQVQAIFEPAPTYPFLDAPVIARDYIYIDADSSLHSHVKTGGHIELRDRAKLCGNAQIGAGQTIRRGNQTVFGGSACGNVGGSVSQGTVNLPDVDQKDARTNNSNWRISQSQNYTGQAPLWNSSQKTLLLNSGTTLTLPQGVYSICSINLNSGATIKMQPGVRVFFDSPENCNQGSGTTQLNINSNSYIQATGSPADVGLYFVGSSSRQTRVNLSSNTSLSQNCTSGMVLYGPRTDFFMNSDSRYCGGIAAKTLWLNSRSQIYADQAAKLFDLDW